MDLTDTVAIVTGASSGLGTDIARLLIERGAHVFGLARREERLEALRDDLGPRFHPVACDVRDQAAVTKAFETVLQEGGRLDILVNNAGLGRFGPLSDVSTDDWDVQLDTNLRGAFLCSQAAVEPMKRQNADTGFGGHIVNIASIAGLIGNPNLSVYNASKFGLRGFSEALMKELRSDGIKVTCVYPGSIATSFGDKTNNPRSKNAMTSVDVARTVLYVLETPENFLISEVVMRPLRP